MGLLFRDYLVNIGMSPAQVKAFSANFDSITLKGVLPQFRYNVWDECRFDDVLWGQFVNAVQKAIQNASTYGSNAGDELTHEVKRIFRPATWQGGIATVPPNTVFGRAVRRNDLVIQWIGILGYTQAKVERLLDGAIQHGPGVLIPDFRGRGIWNYLMWSTFDLSNPSDGPFMHQLTRGEDHTACSLGLPQRTDDLILMEYTLPSHIYPHIPTIANAYAGDVWFAYFRPMCPEAAHSFGRSVPTTARTDGLSCPEVIHASITADNLVNSIRIL